MINYSNGILFFNLTQKMINFNVNFNIKRIII